MKSKRLLGDRVTLMLNRAGVAGMVRKIEQATGWRCGRTQRAAALNRWDAGRRR